MQNFSFLTNIVFEMIDSIILSMAIRLNEPIIPSSVDKNVRKGGTYMHVQNDTVRHVEISSFHLRIYPCKYSRSSFTLLSNRRDRANIMWPVCVCGLPGR